MNLLHNPYRLLEKSLGYRFRKKKFLEIALTHRSWRYEAPTSDMFDNQRLEFLGDAALSLVTSAHLYQTHSDQQEGDLTRRRSLLCNGKTLAQIGERIGLGSFLRLGRGEEQSGGRERPSTLGDALEAVIGAAYLDGGVKAVEKIYRRWFTGLALEADGSTFRDNPKGALQEYCQRRWKTGPEYRLLEVTGPGHERKFSVEVRLRDRVLATARGPSKREAESRAALKALQSLESSTTAS
ncbi:MAG: ribonuclease III [Verrucomicrobia bacterium]|nr:ribonuclease III [Verrucomicrobiota bacterium]